jgi:uncharacterized protein YprB with RNaseH-like and TPR domain
MPDFAKALRALIQQTSSPGLGAAPGRRSPGVVSLADQLQFLRSDTPPLYSRSVLPAGEIRSNSFGSHYFIRNIFPHDYFHGKIRLNRFLPSDLEYLMTLMREPGSVPDRDRIVFLDTETTGIQGGTGTCPFLVGIGYFVGDEFHMVQYFIRDFDEESSMLSALAHQMQQFDLIVTYNGAAFDIPLLDTRFMLARIDNPFQRMSHFDLLFTARKLWRLGHGSCRLVALERELLSFLRGPDIPGAMIPRTYFDYLQRRSAPALESIFTHNVHDVISLAALTIHASDRVTLEPAALDDPLDLYSLGRILENSTRWRRSMQLYDMALRGGLPEPVHRRALENLVMVCRRAGEHDRSLAICATLMRHPEFSIVGYEGAAIYHERVARNVDAALEVVEAGLGRAGNARLKARLQVRWDRLQQRRLALVTDFS